ncbi:EAL domain-containing protein [Butyrivibrio sp. INlla14]|uniref:EAL domain-containing protein n=1 Tax=Butyrivibrio sp. INlla14 TaxID=1520808 RepID=UPI0008763530|nr:EAL domain-containing protein [Butyrivibrio sp. INlla14]SCY53506.1 EAL domain, c-di-GMP-specific phosphodiesterase class I (or its enzymatically inactive variant) [Butyrivibrio sp. INlla14]
MEQKYLLHDIVAAMEVGELQAYYQPQYNAKEGVIGGAEALVRWIKSDGTVVLPGDFIPILEEAGQLSLVDWFVAEDACKTIKQLKDKAVRISVNFSREHAKDKQFIEKLNRLVDSYGIDKYYFGVEITESDVTADKDEVMNWVHSIEKAGYMVSIDDFGSGMSSMSFVKDIPARILKIDRSFLNDNCLTEKGRITLESVFYFAHRLKLLTVVEGVETPEQLQFINTCDCDYIQGYIFSKPIPKTDFINMIKEEAPVEMEAMDLFEDQSAVFEQVRILIESVYKKFQIIKFANISKNSYTFMRRENFLNTEIPETGPYDSCLKQIVEMTVPESKEEIEKAFNRKSLIDAHAAGKKRVMRIVQQLDENGNRHKVAIEDYFMENPRSTDVYIVSFIQNIDFEDGTYV